MAHDLTLWGAGTSRTMRAHWMLLELGLEYDSHPIQARSGETLSEEFLRINPRHKIPVLRHGSFVLTESAAIIQYLSDTFADSARLYVPRDARQRAALGEWCYFIATELDAAGLYIMRRHDALKSTYGDAPVAVESASQYFQHNLEAMAACIKDGEYLFGERFSAADILLMTCLDWAASCSVSVSERFSRYRHRTAARPAYQAARARNFAAQ
ncbi:MAG TPA: glutathione S-transferase family protein [Candidatus Binataceae bacterium]